MGTLEDVLWMARTASRTPDDMWYFVRDWTSPPGIERKFAWDLIDAWEVWRSNGKSFYRGGRPLTLLMLAPHAAEAEWEAAGRWADLEKALARLELPPASAWPLLDEDPDWGYTIGDLTREIVLHVLPLTVPVAVHSTERGLAKEHGDTLWGLAQGTAWKLGHASVAFERAATESGLSGLRIDFSFRDRTDGPALTLEHASRDRLQIGWDARLQEHLLRDSAGVERLVGKLIASVMTEGERDAFLAVWTQAPPGVRVDATTIHQRVRKVTSPIRPHDALRSEAQRRLGAELMESKVAPGRYEGREASQLETSTIYPRLMAMLSDRIRQFDARKLLLFGLTQLERANHERVWREQKLAWQRGFPVHSFGAGAQPEEARERATALVRAISLILEEVLAELPEGELAPDSYAWSELLSIGELCLESATRSEAVHLALTPTAVEVTDSYEVRVHWSDEPTDIDLRRYSEIRDVHTLPDPVPIGHSSQESPDDLDDPQPKPLVELMPELSDLDSALREEEGFGLDALTGVLNTARLWDATDVQPVAASDPATMLRQATEVTAGGTPSELEKALGWLSIRREDLADQQLEHWEVERRPFRMATRPFVRFGAEVFVLPWSSEVALKTFANYLSDGRLPWPTSLFGDLVRAALERYRQRKNQGLERECLSRLDDLDFVTQGPIKPGKAPRMGFQKLSGEIDALCVDDSRSRIWVLEAKDPYTPFSARQIRRLIQDFHEPDGYVDKLLTKVLDVQRDSRSVTRLLKVAESDRDWQVIGMMVTRHPEPAAFSTDPRVAFCTIDQLAAVVEDDGLPRLGRQET